MILLALDASICSVVIAALFLTMWHDGDAVASVALAAALLSVLVLTMMAWEEAL
jgi:hypothetical protein